MRKIGFFIVAFTRKSLKRYYHWQWPQWSNNLSSFVNSLTHNAPIVKGLSDIIHSSPYSTLYAGDFSFFSSMPQERLPLRSRPYLVLSSHRIVTSRDLSSNGRHLTKLHSHSTSENLRLFRGADHSSRQTEKEPSVTLEVRRAMPRQIPKRGSSFCGQRKYRISLQHRVLSCRLKILQTLWSYYVSSNRWSSHFFKFQFWPLPV